MLSTTLDDQKCAEKTSGFIVVGWFFWPVGGPELLFFLPDIIVNKYQRMPITIRSRVFKVGVFVHSVSSSVMFYHYYWLTIVYFLLKYDFYIGDCRFWSDFYVVCYTKHKRKGQQLHMYPGLETLNLWFLM